MSEKPNFEALRAQRDAAIEVVVREMVARLGGDPNGKLTFHSREHGSPCYCACPDGPCEHEFTESREFDDGLGWETYCPKCGEGAMSHSMRFCP